MNAYLLPILFLLGLSAAAQEFGRIDTTLDVLHYDIHVYPDLHTQRLDGRVEITFTTKGASLDELTLDAVEIGIDSVVSSAGVALQWSKDSTKLRVRLPDPLEAGKEAAVSIRYHCSTKKGLHFVAPNATYPGDPHQCWTQGQFDNTRHWLPSHDVPFDKATAEIRIKAKDEFNVVSIGSLVDVALERRITEDTFNRDNPLDTVIYGTYRWVQDTPVSPYLFAFAIGRFQNLNLGNVSRFPMHAYADTSIPAEHLRKSFEPTGRMLTFFQDYIGYRYPWEKYDQITVSRFVHSGMENVSATILADHRTNLDDRARLNYSCEYLVAHELVHQWWGDLVTCRDWEHLWINEGLTTYFQQLWARHAHGEDEAEWHRYQGIERVLSYLDGENPDPVVVQRQYATENVYTKAASVMHLLHEMLGEDTFRTAMRDLARDFEYSTLDSEQMQEHFEEYAGEPLDWFFRQWLYRADYPKINVRWKWDEQARTIAIAAEQEINTGVGSMYRLPLNLSIGVEGAEVDTTVWLEDRKHEYSLSLPTAPLYVAVHRDFPGSIHVDQSRQAAFAMLSDASFIGAKLDASKTLKEYGIDKQTMERLGETARTDAFYGVRRRAANILADIAPDTVAYAEELRKHLIAFTRDDDAVFRAHGYNGLSRFKDRELASIFRNGLQDSSYHVEASALNALLAVDTTGIRELLLPRLRTSTYLSIVETSALDWVGKYTIEALTSEVVRLAKPGHPLLLRRKALETLFLLRYPPAKLAEILIAQLAEPVPDSKILAASALIALDPKNGKEFVREQLESTDDPRIQEYLKTVE